MLRTRLVFRKRARRGGNSVRSAMFIVSCLTPAPPSSVGAAWNWTQAETAPRAIRRRNMPLLRSLQGVENPVAINMALLTELGGLLLNSAPFQHTLWGKCV